MIELNKELSPAVQDSILGIYEKMVMDSEVDQFGYVNSRILQKIALLQNSGDRMERYISAYARIIHELLLYEIKDGPAGEHHKYMTSALYYFCDPYDYIPDLNRDEGYIDDALVFNQCLAMIKELSSETYSHIENFIRDSNI